MTNILHTPTHGQSLLDVPRVELETIVRHLYTTYPTLPTSLYFDLWDMWWRLDKDIDMWWTLNFHLFCKNRSTDDPR